MNLQKIPMLVIFFWNFANKLDNSSFKNQRSMIKLAIKKLYIFIQKYSQSMNKLTHRRKMESWVILQPKNDYNFINLLFMLLVFIYLIYYLFLMMKKVF